MTGLISEYFDGLHVWMNDIYLKEEQKTSLFGNC